MIVALWHRWTENRNPVLLLAIAATLLADVLIAKFVVIPFVVAYVEWVREVWGA